MFLGLLTLITALCISAVAIYYSVAGLVAIFAAAAIPIMIMGGVLEVGKLVTAVWLHRYWKQATWWLKSYLSIAVIVLMLITSMGIFGFLSKAHIEQTAQSTDNLARVETMQSEIDRQLAIVGRAENRIRQLESSEVGADANVQAQIDKEQERIDGAYERIQPAIQEQNQIIANVTALFQTELDRIDEELATLQGYIDAGEIRKAQGMVGTATDGAYGPKTAAAFTAWQDAKRAERAEWLDKIQQAASSPTVVAAREEIARLRNNAEQQIADSNVLINRLRDQLGNSDNAEDVQGAIDEQSERVRSASQEIDRLTEEKIALESEYRKLEAEVGPIKYIAEFVYGDGADNNMLEEAVRWVIIIIIFVFDPLAVLLLIASQYTFEFRRKELEDNHGESLRREWQEYEQARAQRIVDNPGYNNDDTKEKKDELRQEDPREEQQDAEELREWQEEESVPPETGDDPVVAEAEIEEGPVEDVATEKEGSGDNTESSDGDGLTPGTYTGDPQPVSVEQTDDSQQVEKEVEDATADPRSDDLALEYIASQYANNASDNDDDIDSLNVSADEKQAMQRWKAENPDDSLKKQRLYLQVGKISELPWYKYMDENRGKTEFTEVIVPEEVTYIEKEQGEQVKRTAYKQNEEQDSDSTLWKRLRDGE